MPKQPLEDLKKDQLDHSTNQDENSRLTTNHGLRINDNQNSLTGSTRGATLIEDFILREKIHHFDHERIPERIVHARGSAAHGVFELHSSLEGITKAGLFTKTGVQTPVFVRFSTVAGSRGSTDLARDVRGFAVKFYTEEGNYDLVGNNIPVFFIQDAMKFPDLVHAVKPEQDNEIPQASSAHDTFWDFISLMPESLHMIMWTMSDRAIPRSYRMMEGFGVHTFRFFNEENVSTFVKFHWKPRLGTHAVAWDEAQKISGKNPDFHRLDLWEAIEDGIFPQWDLGVQLIKEEDEFSLGIDLLDSTKLIPEELVPVQRIGTLTLTRNPSNFFAETEQVAFNPGHLLPGIDITHDPLLMGRLFSYSDTQLSRLGSHNFQELPINKPTCPVHNNQRDGHMRMTINAGKGNYDPNTLAGGCPFQSSAKEGGFISFPVIPSGTKARQRPASFFDHFSQAKLFYNSQSDPEKKHLTDALCFELGKVKTTEIQERMIHLLKKVDKQLAATVAIYLGISLPGEGSPVNASVPADEAFERYQSIHVDPIPPFSAALSMIHSEPQSIASRKIAVLIADGAFLEDVFSIMEMLNAENARCITIAPSFKILQDDLGNQIVPQETFLTTASVLYDAVLVPGGLQSAAELSSTPEVIHFLNEAFLHCKVIGFHAEAVQVLQTTAFANRQPQRATEDPLLHQGVLVNDDVAQLTRAFIASLGLHRFWDRESGKKVPA